jgi:hypothetical protein
MNLAMPFGPLPGGIAPPYLYSTWTVTVAETSGVGGRGVVTTMILDSTGMPLPGQQGTVTGTESFVLGPNGSASVLQAWNWVIQTSVVPTNLSFVTTIDFTDSLNNLSSQNITVSGVANGYIVSS